MSESNVAGTWVDYADGSGDRLARIREHVETAHREVQAAQRLAYESDYGVGDVAPLRVRLALNKAQNILIKLLIHRLVSR